jgi:nucleoside-diphosphate-sugar epimerase
MKYLLTGAAGFIGMHVAEKLLKKKKKINWNR